MFVFAGAAERCKRRCGHGDGGSIRDSECGVEVKLYSVLSSFISVVAFENGEVLGNYAETVSVDAASLSHNVRSWDMERL